MRWVQQAAISPHRCAAIPFIGNSNTRKGFFDLGMEARERDHLYISGDAAEQMARMMGFVPASVVEHYKRELAAERAENVRLGGVVAELEKFRESAEYTLGAFGAKVRAKPGRKRIEEAAA